VPGGKLPVSWYPEEYTNINMTDIWMRPDPSAGYVPRSQVTHIDSTQGTYIIYDFGYDLSYSNFTHSFLSAPISITAQVSVQGLGACEHLATMEKIERDIEHGPSNTHTLPWRSHSLFNPSLGRSNMEVTVSTDLTP
jgi:hypothetical protein